MNLTIRNIPEEVIKKLKESARSARRSLNREILVRLEQSVRVEEAKSEQDILIRQLKLLRLIAGRWEDKRTSKGINDEIVSYRTSGRDISL